MLKHLEKHRIFISIVFTIVALTTLLFLPVYSRLIGMIIFLTSIGMAMIFLVRNHWHAYLQAECTREKMARSISLDIIGLLLTMAAAVFVGGQAGQWAGLRVSLWAGLAAGFASAMLSAGLVGFLAARVVRSLWGKVAKLDRGW